MRFGPANYIITIPVFGMQTFVPCVARNMTGKYETAAGSVSVLIFVWLLEVVNDPVMFEERS